MRFIVMAAAFLALGACHKPAEGQAENGSIAQGSLPNPAMEPRQGVDRSHKGTPAPVASFNSPDGKPISLAMFRRVPVLVNLWATWCAPCVKELPTLDKLAASHRVDGGLGVIAISQDSAPQASVDAFLKRLKVTDLAPYHDSKMALSAALGPDTVLPTTILYDANGSEVWRYVGDLDWTGQKAAKLLAEAKAGPAS